MKKRFIILFYLIYLTVYPLFAQKGFLFDIYGGPQNTWLYSKDKFQTSQFTSSSSINYKLTYHWDVGQFIGYNFTDHFGIKSGLIYSRQGQKYNITDGDCMCNPATLEINLDYIKIPILFAYTFIPSKPISTTLSLGFQYSNLVSLYDNYQNILLCKVLLPSPETRYTKNDWAGVITFDINYKLRANIYIQTSCRFDYGFGEIFKQNAFLFGELDRFKNTINITDGLTIGFVYILPIKPNNDEKKKDKSK